MTLIKDTISLVKEFKPALIFLLKFLGMYIILSIFYGIYVESFGTNPDTVTVWVSEQTSDILQWFSLDTSIYPRENIPKVALLLGERTVLNLYEGCNGLNVLVIFISFLFAFSGFVKPLLWFIPLGLFIVHLSNLGRIILLFFVAEHFPDYMYFTHKYLFTAAIYVVVFALWVIWVKKYTTPQPKAINN